jgi:hypothetical protein
MESPVRRSGLTVWPLPAAGGPWRALLTDQAGLIMEDAQVHGWQSSATKSIVAGIVVAVRLPMAAPTEQAGKQKS